MKEFLYSQCCLTLTAELKWAERAGREMVFLLVLYLPHKWTWCPRTQAYLLSWNSPHEATVEFWFILSEMNICPCLPRYLCPGGELFTPFIFGIPSSPHQISFLGSLLGWVHDSNHILCLLIFRYVKRVRNNIQCEQGCARGELGKLAMSNRAGRVTPDSHDQKKWRLLFPPCWKAKDLAQDLELARPASCGSMSCRHQALQNPSPLPTPD